MSKSSAAGPRVAFGVPLQGEKLKNISTNIFFILILVFIDSLAASIWILKIFRGIYFLRFSEFCLVLLGDFNNLWEWLYLNEL